MSKLFSLSVLILGSAITTAPPAIAAPADPGCAYLTQLTPHLTDVVSKLNSFQSTVSKFPQQYQKADLVGMIQNVGATGQKAQELSASWDQVQNDIDEAGENTHDPGFRNNLDQLSEAAGQAKEYLGDMGNPFTPNPDTGSFTALAVRTGALLVVYQINYTRVCALGLGGHSPESSQTSPEPSEPHEDTENQPTPPQ